MDFYKKYLSYVLNNRFDKSSLSYLIFFVTSRCDGSCPHCFYRQSLNKYKDLSLDSIREISRSLGDFHILLISGGEPFLRDDLDKILSIFVKQNRVKIINIPTNGLATGRIIPMVKKILDQNKDINVSINPSLDGLYLANDRLRDKNGFIRTIKTIRELEKLKKRYKNLEIVVNTVVSKYNSKEIFSLMSYLRGFNINSHNLELIRDRDLLPDRNAVRRIHHSVMVNREKYLKGFMEKVVVLGSLGYVHSIKEAAIQGKSFSCVGIKGGSIQVLDSNGEMRKCELLEDDKITEDCTCTHVCFIQATIASQFKTLFMIQNYYKIMRFKVHEVIKWR